MNHFFYSWKCQDGLQTLTLQNGAQMFRFLMLKEIFNKTFTNVFEKPVFMMSTLKIFLSDTSKHPSIILMTFICVLC